MKNVALVESVEIVESVLGQTSKQIVFPKREHFDSEVIT